MNKAILAALLAAAPGLALAQSTPNQTNLQDQANQNLQPQMAQPTGPGSGLGQANAIPTPTLKQPMTQTPNRPTTSHSDPIR